MPCGNCEAPNGIQCDMTAKDPPPQPNWRSARPGADAPTRALDAWLHSALAARYDATLAEALPEEMLALLSAMH